MSGDESALVEQAYRYLRGNTKADLRFEEHMRPIRYVIAPGPIDAGRLVAPVMVAMLDAVDTVLFIPECVEDAMEVQVTLEDFRDADGAGGLEDRWRIYHGEPEDVRWATMLIDMVRLEGRVIDGEALMRENPLAASGGGGEAAICRHMNAERTDDLRRICLRYAGIEIEAPVLVGVDPLGIDVRARFDVVRVETPEPMHAPEDARRVLRAMSEAAK